MKSQRRTIPYFKPSIDQDDIDAVNRVLRSGWLTTGPRVQELEREFAARSGIQYAVAVSSCTAALHLGLRAMGVGPGDEVVMPSLTFVAGAQCALHLGATPVFADVDPKTLCLTPETIDPVVTKRTRVIIPMYYGGYPMDIRGIVSYARERKIRVLEDAAHAVGTLDDTGEWPGKYSDGAAFSFYATKNITSGEGGMFLTNDKDLEERVRILSLHGMDRDAWKRYELGNRYAYDVVALGYKYNMPDLTAALVMSQLAKLSTLQARRDRLARIYCDAFEGSNGIVPATQWPLRPARHSWCVFAIIVDDSCGVTRDSVITSLLGNGIGTSVHFPPTHLLASMRHLHTRPLPVTEWAAQRLVSLPLYPDMSDEDAHYVADSVCSAARRSTSRS